MPTPAPLRILLVGLTAAALAAPAAAAQPIETGEPPNCTELVPTALSTDYSTPLVLRVRVLLDGVVPAVAEHAMDLAARSYAPLGIRLQVDYAQAPATTAADPAAFFRAARAATGGVRPDGVHLVYTMTTRDLVGSGASGQSVAGQADCIGGIAFADRGFAVGEVDDSTPYDLPGPGTMFGETTAKIAGHELGHLLGAHHHYANCAEAPIGDEDASGCTLMINDVGLAELRFSSLNAAMIRGHAELWTRRAPGRYEAPAASSTKSPDRQPASRPKPDEPASEPGQPQPAPAPAARPAAAPAPTPTTGSSAPAAGRPSRASSASPPRASASCRATRARLRHARSALAASRRAQRSARTAAGRKRLRRAVSRRRTALRAAERATARRCAR